MVEVLINFLLYKFFYNLGIELDWYISKTTRCSKSKEKKKKKPIIQKKLYLTMTFLFCNKLDK